MIAEGGGGGPAADAGALGGFGMVPVLLRSRVRQVLNATVRGGPARRGWTAVGAVLAGGVVLTGYRITAASLAAGAPPPGQLQPLVGGALVMLCGFTLVTAITFALGSLYFARDLDMLLAAPVPPRAVMLSRIYTQLAFGFAAGGVLAAGPAAALLGATGTPAAAPLVALVVIALVSVPLCAGTALCIAALRLVPARYVRDAGGLLITLVVFGVAAVNLLLRGAGGLSSGGPGGLPLSALGSGPLAGRWLPTGWAARSLAAALEGRAGVSLAWALPVLAVAAVLPVALARAAEHAFVTGYQHNAVSGQGRARRRQRRAAGSLRLPRWAWTVIALKDLREVRRDAAQLGQLLLPIALFALYIANPGRSDLRYTLLPPWYGVALTAAFASLFTASGVALRGVGMEGRRLWVVRVAPLRVRELLAAKFAVGLVVAAVLALGLLWTGGLRQGDDPLTLVAPAVRLVVIVAGLVGLATGLGAVRPRLDWTDPRRSVGVGTSLVFLALGSAYLTVSFVILALPYALRQTGGVAVAAADLALACLAAATAAAALWSGAARLRSLEL